MKKNSKSGDELYAYYHNIFSGVAKPFAFVNLDFLDANIKEILSKRASKKIRIATKSVRSKAILQYILNFDNAFQGLMCYDIDEAIWLSDNGFDDLLIAYPVADMHKIRNLCKYIAKGKTIYLMVDSPEHIDIINSIAEAEKVVLPVCMDLDMSSSYPGLHFGVLRSGINSYETADVFLDYVKSKNNVQLSGIMGYEAQIAGLGDQYENQFFKNLIVKFLKNKSIEEIKKRREGVVELIHKKGFNLDFINGGGTGSISSTVLEKGVTEVTVGSGFYSPFLFDNYSSFKYLPAAAYAIEIVRKPQKNIYTCLGGGYVASGALSMDKIPRVFLPENARLSKNEMAGEVQTPVMYSGDLKLNIGDEIYLRHSKAGELCERFNELILIRNGNIENTVNTYRGDGKCFI